MRPWLPLAALAVVLVAALAVGARPSEPPRSDSGQVDRRVEKITSEVRCPTCQGLSAAESDAKAAEAIRVEVRRRVEEGQSDGEIRAYLVSRYGKDILLRPEASGVAGLVWLLPVAALVVAGAGLVVAFRRWGSGPPAGEELSADDRARVRRALQG